MYSRRLSQLGSDGCCGFFGLFGCVLKVVLTDVSPISVAGIFINSIHPNIQFTMEKETKGQLLS